MPVRNYLIGLVLVCTLGGLLLGAYLIDRQRSFEQQAQQAAALNEHKHDVQRLEDHVKQLLLSIDLLFGAGETYMLDASLSQASIALDLSAKLGNGLVDMIPLERRLQRQVHETLADLQAEIQALVPETALAEFVITSAQLDRVDDLTAGLVDVLSLLSRHIASNVQMQQEEQTSTRSRLDVDAWLVVLLYLISVFGVLWWASRAVSGPLVALSRSARAALTENNAFAAKPNGPAEVRELTTDIGQFVKSLEYTIGQNAALIEAIPDTLFVVHRSAGVTQVKPGIDNPEIIRKLDPSWKSLRELLGESQADMVFANVQYCLESRQQQQFDIALGTGEDRRYYEARATAISGDEAAIVIRDLTAKRHAESRIRHLAFHDGLTGLLNRRAFMESLTEQLQSDSAAPFALLYIDVDRFKTINDTKGHDIGDAVLKHITAAITGTLRSNDRLGKPADASSGSTARLGGDEFVVLLPGVGDPDIAAKIANRIMAAMAKPFVRSDMQLTITVSIGIALYPLHGSSEQEVVNHADLAMFSAKRSGGGAVRIYDHSLGDRNQRKLSMEARLRDAINENALFLAYQPKIDLNSGRITGAEALVRWQDGPNMVPPSEFIPIAEETGLILPLGDFVMRTAIGQAAEWLQQGLPLGSIAINVSAAQLQESGFSNSISELCRSAGLSTEKVHIEITETLLMRDYDRAVALLQTLRHAGYSISLDDFGTGYSSLSHLKALPLDCLKIDRSFVSGIVDSPKERAIIKTIIQLGQTLGLNIVAEGIETQAQANYLREYQCDEAQGFLFSRPLPAYDFEKLLSQQGGRALPNLQVV